MPAAQGDFYGVDLGPLKEDALEFYYSQPIVGPIMPQTIASTSCSKLFDFTSM